MFGKSFFLKNPSGMNGCDHKSTEQEEHGRRIRTIDEGVRKVGKGFFSFSQRVYGSSAFVRATWVGRFFFFFLLSFLFLFLATFSLSLSLSSFFFFLLQSFFFCGAGTGSGTVRSNKRRNR
jgi:hypothetical protein